MRDLLKTIETVDNYLNDKLTAEEKAEFVKDLENSTELQQLVKTQKELIQVVKRRALKEEIKSMKKTNNGFWKSSKWLLGGAFLLIVASLFLVFSNRTSLTKNEQEITKEVDSISNTKSLVIDSVLSPKKDSVAAVMQVPTLKLAKETDIYFNGLSTWVKPEIQTYRINPSAGATIEGDEGTLVIVPSNAFVDMNNKIITEPVQFEMVEALKLEDMVLYNLGTTADGKALETGGMLHFNFLCNGKQVKVNPARPLYVEVPTNEVKKDMMVFEGEVSNKKINWKNPKVLKKYLVNVDFDLLDFLPRGFADTVQTILPFNGHTAAAKELVDSLYYSLFQKEESLKTENRYDTEVPMQREGIAISSTTSSTFQPICCGIEPLAIKTIKTEPYSKTFIATKEFSERVIELHKLEQGNDLLQLYINNLNDNLSHVDSMVVARLGKEKKKVFVEFAAQGLTNIKDAQIYQDKLNKYYNKKLKEYRRSAEELQKELAEKNQAELNQLIDDYKNYVAAVNAKQGTAIFPKFVANMPSANVAINASYSFQWASSGWINIDSYIHLLSAGSEEVTMKISNGEGTMEVYQWLNTINNLTPLVQNASIAKALFPKKNSKYAGQMKNTFCFAISRKDGEYKWFDLRYNPYETKSVNVVLMPSTLGEIKKKLNSYDIKNDIMARLNKVEQEAIWIRKCNDKLKLVNAKIEQNKNYNQIIKKLKDVAFRCGDKSVDFNVENLGWDR